MNDLKTNYRLGHFSYLYVVCESFLFYDLWKTKFDKYRIVCLRFYNITCKTTSLMRKHWKLSFQLTKMLGYFKDEPVVSAFDLEGVQDPWPAFFEVHVNNWSDDSHDLSLHSGYGFWRIVRCFSLCAVCHCW